jgi:two-component system OmpR family response regulator
MNSKPSRILFVDDHQDTLDLFVLALTLENYETVTATSIDSALAETRTRHFDLLILDSWIGDGSGVDLCKRIRERDQSTPILFCSGLAYDHNKKEALDAGAQGYLVKPVSLADLSAAVKELISAPAKRGFTGSRITRKNSGELAIAPS